MHGRTSEPGQGKPKGQTGLSGKVTPLPLPPGPSDSLVLGVTPCRFRSSPAPARPSVNGISQTVAAACRFCTAAGALRLSQGYRPLFLQSLEQLQGSRSPGICPQVRKQRLAVPGNCLHSCPSRRKRAAIPTVAVGSPPPSCMCHREYEAVSGGLASLHTHPLGGC